MENSQLGKGARFQLEEHQAPSMNGMAVLLANIVLILVAVALFILSITPVGYGWTSALRITFMVVGITYSCIIGPVLFIGLKVLKPNEALVLTLFGRYYGTLRGEGFYYVNPFVTAVT